MLSLRKPAPAAIEALLAGVSASDFTYPAEFAGATLATPFLPPGGFNVDHTRVKLGSGAAVFAAAKTALEGWKQYDLGWLQMVPDTTPIAAGSVVASVVRYFGMWWVNPCRVISVSDQSADASVKRFGFAFGTLPGHAECGEERFLLEWDRRDDGVWYDILAFSRPQHILPRLAVPLTRRLQKRFARESAAAMKRLTMS